MYKVVLDREAKKSLKKLPKHEQIRIVERIEGLARNPRPNGITALQGNWRGFYKFRVGNYRVTYNVKDDVLVVCVVKIAHRGHAYEG